MLMKHSLARPVAAVSVAILVAVAAGCSKQADQNNPAVQTTPSQGGAQSHRKAATKLGDLSAFRSIASDVANRSDQQNAPARRNAVPTTAHSTCHWYDSWMVSHCGRIQPRIELSM